MLEFLFVGLALFTALAASYTDLCRDRIIPDTLTLPAIAVGVSLHLAFGLWEGNPYRALSGMLGASLAFLLSYLLWYLGGWAGGDVKLLTAFGALLPTHSPPSSVPPYADLPLFPLTILFNTVILTLPFLGIYSLLCLLRGKNPFYERVRITELREGMIPAEYLYEREGKIRREEALLSLGPPPSGRRFTDPRRASGLTRAQIRVLRRLVREGRVEDHLKVKKGVPFAPFLAVGLLSALCYGDLYWALVLRLTSLL